MPPTNAKSTPAPSGTKRKRGVEFSIAPKLKNDRQESLIVGKTVQFIVGETQKDFYIHEKLAIENSPFLADLVRKGQVKIDEKACLFDYFFNWIYDKDGGFGFNPGQVSRPYARLVGLYLLAYKMRVPAFVNAVLRQIMVTYKTIKQVADNRTIKYIYNEGLEDLEIHELFADQVAHFGQSSDFTAYDKLDFVKAVLGRLPLMRDGNRKGHPLPEHYYIKTVPETSPEPEEEESDVDDCMIIHERPASGAPRLAATGCHSVKRERSMTAGVEA